MCDVEASGFKRETDLNDTAYPNKELEMLIINVSALYDKKSEHVSE